MPCGLYVGSFTSDQGSKYRPIELIHKFKHFEDRLVGVFCFTPGLCQDLGDFGTFALKILVPMFVYF